MKRLVLIVCLMVSFGALSATPAQASDEWCDIDPVMLIFTPHGALIPVFVNTSGQGVLHAPQVLLTTMTYTVKPAKGGKATDVDAAITVPTDLLFLEHQFSTRTTVSTGPLGTGKVYGSAQGKSGGTMHVTFQLPVG